MINKNTQSRQELKYTGHLHHSTTLQHHDVLYLCMDCKPWRGQQGRDGGCGCVIAGPDPDHSFLLEARQCPDAHVEHLCWWHFLTFSVSRILPPWKLFRENKILLAHHHLHVTTIMSIRNLTEQNIALSSYHGKGKWFYPHSLNQDREGRLCEHMYSGHIQAFYLFRGILPTVPRNNLWAPESTHINLSTKHMYLWPQTID